MEPGGSLPYSQEPAIGPYPELDAHNPHLSNLFPSIPRSSKLALPFTCSDCHVVSVTHLSHARYMPRQSHSYWQDHPNMFGEAFKLWGLLRTCSCDGSHTWYVFWRSRVRITVRKPAIVIRFSWLSLAPTKQMSK